MLEFVKECDESMDGDQHITRSDYAWMDQRPISLLFHSLSYYPDKYLICPQLLIFGLYFHLIPRFFSISICLILRLKQSLHHHIIGIRYHWRNTVHLPINLICLSFCWTQTLCHMEGSLTSQFGNVSVGFES